MPVPDLSFLKIRRVSRMWVALGILVLAVPFALFLVSMKGCACVSMTDDRAQAVRTGPETIRIVMHPDAAVNHDRPPVLAVFANDRDVSSQAQVRQEGLSLSVSPAEGLAFREGAEIVLQGSWVAGNASVPVHVWTVATYDTGEVRVIGDLMI